MGNYTVYVNPYLVLRSGGYTKHYYNESQRVVSKLGSGWDNSGKGPIAAAKAGNGSVNYAGKTQQVGDGIVRNLKSLGIDGAELTAAKSSKVPPGQLSGTTGAGTAETFQYYFPCWPSLPCWHSFFTGTTNLNANLVCRAPIVHPAAPRNNTQRCMPHCWPVP